MNKLKHLSLFSSFFTLEISAKWECTASSDKKDKSGETSNSESSLVVCDLHDKSLSTSNLWWSICDRSSRVEKWRFAERTAFVFILNFFESFISAFGQFIQNFLFVFVVFTISISRLSLKYSLKAFHKTIISIS